MTLADDLLPTVYNGRAIAGAYGFRSYQAKLVFEWADPESGDGTIVREEFAIVEAGGQSPRVKQAKGEDIPFGNAPGNLWTVGPITPAFAGGGFDTSKFVRALEDGESRFVFLRGPLYPAWERFSIVHVEIKPLRCMLFVQATNESLDGFT
jgi:hypothetical protein